MIQIFINDEEVTCESNFTIKEEFMNVSHIELYKVYPKSWKGTNKLLTDYYFPEDYSKCKIYIDNELVFVGIVKNNADMELNPFKPHYCSLQILDPSTFLSEGDTLDFVIVNKNVEDAINQVIDAIKDYGFVKGNILIPEEQNTIIGAYSTLEKAPYDVFQYFSLITGTRWGTRMIDENTTAIDFFSPELLNNQGTLEITKEFCGNNKIENFTYDCSTSDYRNKQIITSDEVFANISQIQTIFSDGYSTNFFTEQKIGKIVSVAINGALKTFATTDERDIGVVADFYYKVSEAQFTSNSTVHQGDKIVIEYVPIVKGREISINIPEITRINNMTGRKGTISRYENRNDVTNSKELQKVGETYIKYKGLPELTLNITSRKNFLKLGGKYHFEAPIQKLNGDYLVKAKNTKLFYNTKILQVVYEYVLTNTFDTENDINYFDNQRAKMNGNIAQGEYIARNVDIESTTNIVFSNLQIEEITVLNDTTLELELESTLIG